MKLRATVTILITVLSSGVVCTSPAHAYIDPGTGSMIVQAVIAAVAAISVSIGVFRRRLASFLGRLFQREKRLGDDSDNK